MSPTHPKPLRMNIFQEEMSNMIVIFTKEQIQSARKVWLISQVIIVYLILKSMILKKSVKETWAGEEIINNLWCKTNDKNTNPKLKVCTKIHYQIVRIKWHQFIWLTVWSFFGRIWKMNEWIWYPSYYSMQWK